MVMITACVTNDDRYNILRFTPHKCVDWDINIVVILFKISEQFNLSNLCGSYVPLDIQHHTISFIFNET
jgi:hypothetical protein